MTGKPDINAFPDPYRVLLPSFAYLRSIRDQTLPARATALEDAISHFTDAEDRDDADYRDLALLGLIGEALQILEDLAAIATEPPKGFPAPNYVAATMYSPSKTTSFYQGLKKRSDDRILALVGLRVPTDSGYISLHELFQIALAEDTIEALREAEHATATLLRQHLFALASIWDDLGGYFNAFKHGGLSLNRDDYFVADDKGAELDISPSLTVWARRKDQGMVLGGMNLSPRDVADHVTKHAWIARALIEYIVTTRLFTEGLFEFDDAGTVTSIKSQHHIPWVFWLKRADVSPAAIERLEAIGIVFPDGAPDGSL